MEVSGNGACCEWGGKSCVMRGGAGDSIAYRCLWGGGGWCGLGFCCRCGLGFCCCCGVGFSEGSKGGVVDELGKEVEGGLSGCGGGVVKVAPEAFEGGGAYVFMELLEDEAGQEVEVLGRSEFAANRVFDGAT